MQLNLTLTTPVECVVRCAEITKLGTTTSIYKFPILESELRLLNMFEKRIEIRGSCLMYSTKTIVN